MHRKTVIAAVVGAALSLAPAFALDQRVVFDRAQLDDPAYVAALYADIEKAAKKECFKALTSSLYYQQRFAECVEASVAAAIAEIDSPALVAYAAAE